jgi:ribosomal protein S18 acetylase RimI-like enzyme
MIPELVSAWADGWAVSRGTTQPVAHPWGWYIDVGLPHHVGRHVVPVAEESAVRAAAESVSTPHTWLKVAEEAETVARWLPAGWEVDVEDTGHLMAVDLRATEPSAPEGYTVSVETTPAGATTVLLFDLTGVQAANGQLGLSGTTAVFDRIGTDPAHRRRGLGNFVMRTLADHAAAAGASVGVLGATDEGRALYESLGWKRQATLAACEYRP